MARNIREAPNAASSRLAVIEALLEAGPMSRSDLAAKVNLTRSALTGISRDLIHAGLLREVSVVRNSLRKGRPSTLVSLNEQRGYFVGIDLAEDPQIMVLTNLLGVELDQCRFSGGRTPEDVVGSIRRCLQGMMKSRRISRREVLSAGIALSGFVDHDNGICNYSAALDWHDVPIAGLVKRAIGIRTYIENDANAIAVAEKLFGEARDARSFSVIVLGGGIGCAHYIHGHLYRGSSGGAGEIGHMMTVRDGLQCRCGRRGCLDTVAGSDAIVSAAIDAGLAAKTIQDVEILATKGNVRAIAILRTAGEALGLAVANVIQVNNPGLVLFADVAGFENGVFCTTARQTVENGILPRFLSSTCLRFHHVAPSFQAGGAASVAAHEFLVEQAASMSL